ncbi:MAG: DUF885 domain-containing protein [Saprospiraceae bacterium]|nr:DUF885 domain-containing protein [Saprospiraceae bacterium]
MKKIELIFILILFATGCSEKAAQTPANSIVSTDYFLKYIESQDSILDMLLPQRSAERGEFVISQMSKWDDASSEGEKKIFDYHHKRLDYLKQLNTSQLDEFATTQYKILRFESELAVESEKFHKINNAFSANHFYSVPSALEGWLHANHRVSNEQEALAYVNRLKGVPALFQEIIKKIASAQQSGIVSSTSEVEKSISRYKEMAQSMVSHNSTTDEDINIKFKQFPALKSIAKQVLEDSVANAYSTLSAFLENKILRQTKPEIGLWQYPDGLAYYKYLLKVQTSLDITPDEVFEIGTQAVEYYRKQIIDLKNKSEKNHNLSLVQYFDTYRSNGSVSSKDFKQQMEIKAKEMEPLWGKLFDIKIPSVSIIYDPFEGRAREELDLTVNPPKPVFYLNPNATPDDYLYYNWDMLELLAHEGIPGHGLEQYYTALLKLPKFRKNFSFNSYAEGWALYAEYLPKEIGFYQDEKEEFGRLASSLFRACRLVIDAGIHTGKMKDEEAMHFLLENSPYPKGMLQSQVLRYTAMPAQACCYYLGANLIWNLRKEAESTLGKSFDIRRFHSVVLRDGNIPLDILEKNVKNWIKESKAD